MHADHHRPEAVHHRVRLMQRLMAIVDDAMDVVHASAEMTQQHQYTAYTSVERAYTRVEYVHTQVDSRQTSAEDVQYLMSHVHLARETRQSRTDTVYQQWADVQHRDVRVLSPQEMIQRDAPTVHTRQEASYIRQDDVHTSSDPINDDWDAVLCQPDSMLRREDLAQHPLDTSYLPATTP